MRRTSTQKSVALVVAASAVFGTVTASAAADRRATKRETSAIKRVALTACPPPEVSDCTFHRARVSTRDARFAWAGVSGEGLSGLLLKRPSSHSRRFRIVGYQGGGIGSCQYWRTRAPRKVLRDLHVKGLVGSNYEVRTCG